MDPLNQQNQPPAPQAAPDPNLGMPPATPAPQPPLPPMPELPASPMPATPAAPVDTLGGDPMLAGVQQPQQQMPPVEPMQQQPQPLPPLDPIPPAPQALPQQPDPVFGGEPQVAPTNPLPGPEALPVAGAPGQQPMPVAMPGLNDIATPANHEGGGKRKVIGVVIVIFGVLALIGIIAIVIRSL